MTSQETSAYLAVAAEVLADSEMTLAQGSFRTATSRAYYAMFYCASALLHTKGLRSSRHGNVVAAFGREFAKTGLLDAKFHRFLSKAFDARQASDYEVLQGIPKETAALAVQRAREFLEATRAYLAANPPAPADPATSR